MTDMERTIEVRHVSMKINASFESFTRSLEQSLGRFDPALCNGIEEDPSAVRKRIEKAAGDEGLMLFNVRDHGRLLTIVGSPRRARQYVVGNPLIAISMTLHDIRAGLYAPLRLYVYEEDDGSTMAEFDLPSTLFGQFGNPEVTSIGKSLDQKLLNLMKKAESAGSVAGTAAVQ
jgi:uncharacterized protein (DUF302 family)